MRFDNNTNYDDESHNSPRWENKDSLFYWVIFILLLVLFAVFCWAGSYFIFGHPENPLSYKILKKLNKLDVPKKFELTAAPKGEFLDAKALLERYGRMTPTQLSQTNAALLRNFIRNYRETSDLVPYITGTYSILDSFELTPNDLFLSGVVALAQATDVPRVILESVYPSDQRVVPILHRTLLTGLNIRLERRFDLCALIHVKHLPDGRILFTTMPILYGNYASNYGPGSFSLKPPDPLNIEAGLPVLSDSRIDNADKTYIEYLRKNNPETPSTNEKVSKNSSNTTPEEQQQQQNSVVQDQLVRIEKPVLSAPEIVSVQNNPHPPNNIFAKKRFLTTSPSKTFVKTPSAPASVEEVKIARAMPAQATLTATPFPTQPKDTAPSPEIIKAALPADLSNPPPLPNPTPLTELPPSITAAAATATTPAAPPSVDATPPPEVAFTNVASGSWQTYSAGQMPLGRLMEPSEIHHLADKGLSDERIYLKGNFLVTASRANRAVLRSQNSNFSSKVRIIVEFPSNSKTPELGTHFNRGAQRPFLVTDVQKAPGGMINVFVREITHD